MSPSELSPSSAHVPPMPAPPAAPRDGDSDDIDPELIALPDPPRRERSIALLVLGVTVAASLAMTVTLLRDAAYALSPSTAADLGDLRVASPAAAGANRYVRAQGLLGGVGSMRYERPFEADSYRIAPVAGRPDIWVEVRVPAGQESSRFVPPSSFAGRLVPFAAAGPRHRGLESAIQSTTREAVPGGSWLLVDGETPERARWAVALIVLFLGFAAWNAAAMARLVRKVGV